MVPAAPTATSSLTSFFWSGEALRSRSVSTVVRVGTLDIPAPPHKVVADWERDIAGQLGLAPGDVEALPLARTRLRWPQLKHCLQAASAWMREWGVLDVLSRSELALMACRGARYHHDALQYGGAAFCNLFLSDDQGLDLHFPVLNLRIPLRRGTAVVFDTGQPHAVIPRDKCVTGGGFSIADFPPQRKCSQVFLTWELALEGPGGKTSAVAQALGVDLDTASATAASLTGSQLWCKGAAVQLCPGAGDWI